MEKKDFLKQKAFETSVPQKSEALSAVLGFFFPVIGALYTGRYILAIIFLVVEIIFILLWFIIIGAIFTLLFHIIAAFVCYNGARKQNAEYYHKAAEAIE